MPPQTSIPPAANILGTIGTVFWCVQLVPQIWHNWKSKNTDGLPRIMMLLWAISAVAFGAYAVIQNFNIPIQIQPQMWGTLSLVTWAQILIYSHKWSVPKATATASGLFILFGGIEALLILPLKGPYDRGVEWPVVVIGSFAAVVLALGILPPYPELWKRRGRVVGINFVFLGMDALGAIFSLLALVAQHTFDILGGVLYIAVILLEAGIFTSHLIWLYRTRAIRKQAKSAGIDFDELPEARPYQVHPTPTEAAASAAASAATETITETQRKTRTETSDVDVEMRSGSGSGSSERGEIAALDPTTARIPPPLPLCFHGASD